MSIQTEKGEFGFDTGHLLDTCMHQFTDPNRYLVEFLINSFDAKSPLTIVSGEEDDTFYTISVKDKGHGMSKDRCINNCITKFNSFKTGDDAIGEHGLGMISVFVDSNFSSMIIDTKTRKETNVIRIDDHISNIPKIRLLSDAANNEITGTTITVKFKKGKGFNLRKKMLSLKNHAENVLEFLPARIEFYIPSVSGEEQEIFSVGMKNLKDEGYYFSWEIKNYQFDIILKVGINLSGVLAYQKNVLVTREFEELELKNIPNFQIIINSSDYKLPFGRDKIILTQELKQILNRLRDFIMVNCLPDTFYLLTGQIENEELLSSVVIGLLNLNKPGPWEDYPVFRIMNTIQPYCSKKFFDKHRSLGGYIYYIENSGTIPGIDLERVTPLIDAGQNRRNIDYLFSRYNANIRIIKTTEGVFAIPPKDEDPARDSLLEQLCFNFRNIENDSLSEFSLNSGEKTFNIVRQSHKDNFKAKENNKTLWDELLSIQFDLGYLYNAHDSSPNFDYKFHYTNSQVVFNLHHPEIKQIIAYRDSRLAAHRAICIALIEKNGILQGRSINPKIVDTLLMFDLISRFKNPDFKLLKSYKSSFGNSFSEN